MHRGNSSGPWRLSGAFHRATEFVCQPQKIILVALLLATVGFGFYTVRRIWNHGKYTVAFQFNLTQLPSLRGHRWIHPEVFAAAFDSDPYLSQSHSIFESDVTRHISEALTAIPWVERVPYVRKSMPNRIELDLVPREPLVRVRGYGTNFDSYLADRAGVRLDKSFYDFSTGELILFEVIGVTGPPPPIGQRWADDAVRGAAAVANALKGWSQYEKTARIYGNEIYVIDVSNYRRRRNPQETNEITLITRHGNRVRWGRAPSEGLALESPVAEKLAWLYRIYRLDNARKRSRYDIRYSGRFAAARG